MSFLDLVMKGEDWTVLYAGGGLEADGCNVSMIVGTPGTGGEHSGEPSGQWCHGWGPEIFWGPRTLGAGEEHMDTHDII